MTGPVVFPITTDADGPLIPRMYPGWANAWLQTNNIAVVFAGHPDGTPRFFSVDLSTGLVARLSLQMPYGGTTEGWSWDREGRILLLEGPRLRRVNPLTGLDEVLLDITDLLPGCDLWQSHSSDNGRVHAATVRDPQNPLPSGAYPYLGTVILHNGERLYESSIAGALDESAVTRDGSFVIIKERHNEGDDNRILDLDSGDRWWIADQERAVGHSDCGPDFIVGEADKPDPGGCGIWYLRDHRFQFLFPTLNMGYVSYGGGVCLHTDDTTISRLDLVLGERTPLVAHGVTATDYDSRVKANLDYTGRVATYMANGHLYLLRL